MTLEQAKLLVARATPVEDCQRQQHPEQDLTQLISSITPYYYSDWEKDWGYHCDGQGVFVSVGQNDVASSLVYKIEKVENLLFMIGRE